MDVLPGLLRRLVKYGLFLLGVYPVIVQASFIEATIGTAVVNDATATDHNPAALTLLKSPQLIALGSLANFHTQFTGQYIPTVHGLTLSGTAAGKTAYQLPSFYAGIPTQKKITLGFAVKSDQFNSEVDDTSILRYAQSKNH